MGNVGNRETDSVIVVVNFRKGVLGGGKWDIVWSEMRGGQEVNSKLNLDNCK